MQVVLSGFNVRLFSFVQAKTLCRYGSLYLLSMSLLGFGMWTMLANFHMCRIMLMLKVVLSCVFDGVCELFGETIRNMFGCGCYFVV